MSSPTFYRIDEWVKAANGPAIAGAEVYFCSQPASTGSIPPSPLAQLYADPLGVTPISQPLISDGFGYVSGYIAPGTYTMVVAISSILQQVYPDQSYGLASSTASFPVSGNSPIIASALTNLETAPFGTLLIADGAGNVEPNASGISIDGTNDLVISVGNVQANAYVSNTVNPSTTGHIRLATTNSIRWRNAANSADLALSKDTSDNLLLTAFPVAKALALSAVASSTSGNLPSIVSGAQVVSDASFTLGSGTASAYGVVSSVRAAGDASGDKVFGGWFRATAQNNTSTEVGLHAECADSGGVIAEFVMGGSSKVVIAGTGKVSTYNGLPVVGNGIASVLSTDSQTALGANYNSGSAKSLLATPAAGGIYRISGAQAINRAATSTSTFPSLTLGYTDAGGIARTVSLVATSASNATTVVTNFSTTIHASSAAAITLTSASYASSGATSMQFSLGYTLEQIA